jgi:hypothetical protein
MPKKIAVFLIILFQLSACNAMNSSNTHKFIKIEGYEMNETNHSLTNANSDYISSEYLDLKYSGDKTYNIDVEIWEHGEIVDTLTEVSNLQLSDYDGISFELDESDKKQYDIAINFYQKSNKTLRHLKISKENNDLSGRTESTYMNRQEIEEDKEVFLWGFHKFEGEFGPLINGNEAAEVMDWSLVFYLRPVSQ